MRNICVTSSLKHACTELYQHNSVSKLKGEQPFLHVTHCWLVGLILYIPVDSYGHVEMDGSPNHTFFLGKLDLLLLVTFFLGKLHILLLVTDIESAEWRRMAVEIIS